MVSEYNVSDPALKDGVPCTILVVVIDVETLHSAQDCRHCGMAEEQHGFHNICETPDLRMIGARHTPIGWEDHAVLGLSIGCLYRYDTGRYQFFDPHTLDTSTLTWVISGRRDAADRAIVVRSGGYPEHACS